MGNKILKSLQFPGSSNRYKIPQSDYAQTDSTQPDYIKNKLVGEEVTYSDTLTWDGNPEGKEAVVYIPSSGIGVYKMSDIVLSIEDFKNGCTVVAYFSGSEQTIECTASEIINDNGMLVIANYLVMVIPYDNFVDSEGTQYAKKGICFNSQSMSGHELYVKSFTIHGQNIFPTTTTKKLTAEYLEPFEVVTKGGDTLTWDGDTSGLEPNANVLQPNFFITDKTPLPTEVTTVTITKSDNTVEEMGIVDFMTGSGVTTGSIMGVGSSKDGKYALLIMFEDFSEDGMTMYRGIYFSKNDAGDYISALTIPNYTGFTTTEKKLKGEYVIDTNSIILRASGGKRFKVTVSDTGTLTATEI